MDTYRILLFGPRCWQSGIFNLERQPTKQQKTLVLGLLGKYSFLQKLFETSGIKHLSPSLFPPPRPPPQTHPPSLAWILLTSKYASQGRGSYSLQCQLWAAPSISLAKSKRKWLRNPSRHWCFPSSPRQSPHTPPHLPPPMPISLNPEAVGGA